MVLIPSTLMVSSFTNPVSVKSTSQNRFFAWYKPLPPVAAKKVKIALLLDTSNSMDGLINQAKSQLWKLVNELAKLKSGEQKPELEIALYEYGNSGLNEKEGYIRQVSPFSNDLDVISEKLFALTTNGGNEFCGYVIRTSVDELQWSKLNDNLQIIFIAGNEPFTQGSVSYESACSTAKEKEIYVNTIYCGSYDEGVSTKWKSGASLTGGSYMNIDHNQKTIYIETPYDVAIEALNDKLNSTYIYYGSDGYSKKQNQIKQDQNASIYGTSNSTERVLSKVSGFYKNSTWDLVDASDEKEFDILKIKEENLPNEIKGKSAEYKLEFIKSKKAERRAINDEIVELSKKRMAFILEKQKTLDKGASNSLDAVMIDAIKKQAVAKGFEI
jgi:hypothetical protein